MSAVVDRIRAGEPLSSREREIVANVVKAVLDAVPERGAPFICGESGTKGEDGLPERLLVCPMPGLAGFAVYKKDVDYSEPGY